MATFFNFNFMISLTLLASYLLLKPILVKIRSIYGLRSGVILQGIFWRNPLINLFVHSFQFPIRVVLAIYKRLFCFVNESQNSGE